MKEKIKSKKGKIIFILSILILLIVVSTVLFLILKKDKNESSEDEEEKYTISDAMLYLELDSSFIETGLADKLDIFVSFETYADKALNSIEFKVEASDKLEFLGVSCSISGYECENDGNNVKIIMKEEAVVEGITLSFNLGEYSTDDYVKIVDVYTVDKNGEKSKLQDSQIQIGANNSNISITPWGEKYFYGTCELCEKVDVTLSNDYYLVETQGTGKKMFFYKQGTYYVYDRDEDKIVKTLEGIKSSKYDNPLSSTSYYDKAPTGTWSSRAFMIRLNGYFVTLGDYKIKKIPDIEWGTYYMESIEKTDDYSYGEYNTYGNIMKYKNSVDYGSSEFGLYNILTGEFVSAISYTEVDHDYSGRIMASNEDKTQIDIYNLDGKIQEIYNEGKYEIFKLIGKNSVIYKLKDSDKVVFEDYKEKITVSIDADGIVNDGELQGELFHDGIEWTDKDQTIIFWNDNEGDEGSYVFYKYDPKTNDFVSTDCPVGFYGLSY